MNSPGKVQTSFWRNKKVLVTGHTGFKGSWLTFWLKQLGAEVLGYALPPKTQPSLFDVMKISQHCRHVEGDIRDEKKLDSAVQEFNPEIIFHMAAQALVLDSYEQPKMTYETNVIGTLNLLESARRSKSLKTLINITTDKVYENKEWNWGYREVEALGGYDPYSSSKACSEILTSSYRRSFFKDNQVRILTCRAGNVFGGGDWSDNRIIPDSVRAFAKNEPLIVRNPFAVRPWQHVLEPLRAYLMLAERSFKSEMPYYAWNIGPTDEDAVPVGQLADLAKEFWGENAAWKVIGDAKPGPHEAKYLKLDCSLARSELNWLPIINLKQGIKMTVDWYKSYYKKGDVNALSSLMSEQIRTCME